LNNAKGLIFAMWNSF